MSHASMLKARRQHQKTKKLLDVAAKQAKRLAKQALAGPAVKKERVKKEKVKKEKVETEKVKKVKLTKEELGRQDAKKSSAGAGKKRRVLALRTRDLGRHRRSTSSFLRRVRELPSSTLTSRSICSRADVHRIKVPNGYGTLRQRLQATRAASVNESPLAHAAAIVPKRVVPSTLAVSRLIPKSDNSSAARSEDQQDWRRAIFCR